MICTLSVGVLSYVVLHVCCFKELLDSCDCDFLVYSLQAMYFVLEVEHGLTSTHMGWVCYKQAHVSFVHVQYTPLGTISRDDALGTGKISPLLATVSYQHLCC